MYAMISDQDRTPINLVKIVTIRKGWQAIDQYAVCEFEGEEFEVELDNLTELDD